MSKYELKDDEDYWNSSEGHSFSFDQNNEPDNLFGISKNGTAQLRAGISNINSPTDPAPSYLTPESADSTFKPLLAIISEPVLMTILNADNRHLISDNKLNVNPSVTVRRILLGQTYSLENYKSLSNKTALLDAAIASGSGNVILIVTLFIIKTLKSGLSQKIFMERLDAINVYVHYLSTRLQVNEVTDLLMMQGRLVDAAFKNLAITIKNTRDDGRLLQKLIKCYKTQFVNFTEYKESLFVNNYIKLLEWKIALNSGGNKNLANNNVLDCLKYICENNWNSSQDASVSPARIFANQHDITPRQYQKTVLKTRVSVQAWDDVNNILLSKGWLGSEKLQSNLPIEDILKILHQGQAPTSVIEKYLKYVDNMRNRLQLAKNYGCAKAVVEILGLLGDRTALLEYKDTLTLQSEAHFLAEKTLASVTIRWKS
ncbi:spermatogenesis-defective protein 39 homolog [Microplitis demolitor]|uniref:spermatogenesis-defective protein 39 homolog n=1 Tax=Microplitis demolitor TaxID=69319 RepID=UPI0004CCC5DF|nr:spermatogenesis-defective protein 39 homolog [Microplitis demolitor]XP_008554788.1 spermatogenesis-defective protein 39 homolog [Microplitis demolitor]XP_008554789.1 spermatogenesis-defective protein 39 homolog [Microplitis demolitor]